MCVCVCVCVSTVIVLSEAQRLMLVATGWVDKSDEAFCIKSATERTTEAVSHSVHTAFRLPNLHMK